MQSDGKEQKRPIYINWPLSVKHLTLIDTVSYLTYKYLVVVMLIGNALSPNYWQSCMERAVWHVLLLIHSYITIYLSLSCETKIALGAPHFEKVMTLVPWCLAVVSYDFG